jgi:hypothetical protein
MQTIAGSLRRFVDPDEGPITAITSAPYPSFWRRQLWHSVAPLHERWVPKDEKLQVMKYAGGGWSRDREESQCTAVTEAVERWALRHYTLNSPADAGLDIDPTSNGFAALPASMGEDRVVSSAYCEALERWALARLWDQGDFPARAVSPEDSVAAALLPASHGECRFFTTILKPAAPNLAGADRLTFVLCLVKTTFGGVLPGSACGADPQRTLERAACEARVHVNVFKRLHELNGAQIPNQIERRLRHFAEHPSGFDMVARRLNVLNTPPAIEAPAPIFNRRLSGDWEPEILVHRVMVEQAMHLQEGGLERFLI